MLDMFLNVADDTSGIRLVPTPIEVFSGDAELDDEVLGEILGRYFTTFLVPQPQ